MLLRMQFIESKRRSAILDDGSLARIYPFSNRLPMMHRAGWEVPEGDQRDVLCLVCLGGRTPRPDGNARISWKETP